MLLDHLLAFNELYFVELLPVWFRNAYLPILTLDHLLIILYF